MNTKAVNQEVELRDMELIKRVDQQHANTVTEGDLRQSVCRLQLGFLMKLKYSKPSGYKLSLLAMKGVHLLAAQGRYSARWEKGFSATCEVTASWPCQVTACR